MNPPALLVLAAGQGKRFGGPKQLATVGPQDEILIAYTIHDAVRAGFQHIVIVTREPYADLLGAELGPMVDRLGATLSIAIQVERPHLQPGETSRAWGTGHAILSARSHLTGSFAVANGDDWYGPTAYRLLMAALRSVVSSSDTHFLVTYAIANTLTDTKCVSRAHCTVRDDGTLAQIEERLDVHYVRDRIVGFTEGGDRLSLPPATPVSTNLWGFRPSMLEHLVVRFTAFSADAEVSAIREFSLPAIINDLLDQDSIRVETLPTLERLFGLTSPEDLPRVRARIAALVASGVYPPDLRSG